MTTWDARATLLLLRRIRDYDQRLSLGDTEIEVLGKAESYAKVLNQEGIDTRWADKRVIRYYTAADADAPLLTVGMLVRWWREEERVANAKARTIEAPEHLTSSPAWPRAYHDRIKVVSDEMWARGVRYNSPEWRAAIDAVPTFRESGPAPANYSERHCGVRECVCRHETCFDGWLDMDLLVPQRGQLYVKAQRCPACHEALLARSSKDVK